MKSKARCAKSKAHWLVPCARYVILCARFICSRSLLEVAEYELDNGSYMRRLEGVIALEQAEGARRKVCQRECLQAAEIECLQVDAVRKSQAQSGLYHADLEVERWRKMLIIQRYAVPDAEAIDEAHDGNVFGHAHQRYCWP